jgi:hypothetical protein
MLALFVGFRGAPMGFGCFLVVRGGFVVVVFWHYRSCCIAKHSNGRYSDLARTVHGAPEIAIGGFHSQAGWITFSGVTPGFAAVISNASWLVRQRTIKARGDEAARNPAALYLAPFMAILVASLVAEAASSGFEWLYPLRFLAAGITLWKLQRN